MSVNVRRLEINVENAYRRATRKMSRYEKEKSLNELHSFLEEGVKAPSLAKMAEDAAIRNSFRTIKKRNPEREFKTMRDVLNGYYNFYVVPTKNISQGLDFTRRIVALTFGKTNRKLALKLNKEFKLLYPKTGKAREQIINSPLARYKNISKKEVNELVNIDSQAIPGDSVELITQFKKDIAMFAKQKKLKNVRIFDPRELLGEFDSPSVAHKLSSFVGVGITKRSGRYEHNSFNYFENTDNFKEKFFEVLKEVSK